MIMTPYYANFRYLAEVISGKASIESFWISGRFQSGDFSVAEQIKVADYIRNKTNPTDRVANFGIDPGITFPVWREPVLRFANIISSDPRTLFFRLTRPKYLWSNTAIEFPGFVETIWIPMRCSWPLLSYAIWLPKTTN